MKKKNFLNELFKNGKKKDFLIINIILILLEIFEMIFSIYHSILIVDIIIGIILYSYIIYGFYIFIKNKM